MNMNKPDLYTKIRLSIIAFTGSKEAREKVIHKLESYNGTWTENILKKMTYDREWDVSLAAIMALSSGTSDKTLRRLKKLTTEYDEVTRAKAYIALLHVVMNRNQCVEKEKALKWIRRKYRQEDKDYVKFYLVAELYNYGFSEYFTEVQKLIDKNLKPEILKKTDHTWTMIYVLEQMKNKENADKIKAELLKIEPYMNLVQKYYVEKEWAQEKFWHKLAQE